MGSASFLPSVLPEPLAPRDEPVRGLRLVTRRNKRPKQGRVSGLLPHVISPPIGSAKVFHNSFVDSRGDENKYKKTSNGLFVCNHDKGLRPSHELSLKRCGSRQAEPVFADYLKILNSKFRSALCNRFALCAGIKRFFFFEA